MAKIVSKEEYERLRRENGGRAPKGYRNPDLAGKGFDANPQNRNVDGAKKSIQSIINRMRKENFVELDKKSLLEIYKLMFNTPENELKKIAKDPNTPFGVKVIWENLQDPRTRARAWNEYQTWVFGKAPDAGDVAKSQKKDIDFENMNEEEKKAYMTIVKNINKDLDEHTGTNN